MQVDLVIYRVFCTALFRLSFCLFNCAIVNLTQGILSNLTSLLSFLSSSFRNYSLLSSLSLLPPSPLLSSLLPSSSSFLQFSSLPFLLPLLSLSALFPFPLCSFLLFLLFFLQLPSRIWSFLHFPLSPLPISPVPLPRERVCYWK